MTEAGDRLDEIKALLKKYEHAEPFSDESSALFVEISAGAVDDLPYLIERAETAARSLAEARQRIEGLEKALRRLYTVVGEAGGWRDGQVPGFSLWTITTEEDLELDAAIDDAKAVLSPTPQEPASDD